MVSGSRPGGSGSIGLGEGFSLGISWSQGGVWVVITKSQAQDWRPMVSSVGLNFIPHFNSLRSLDSFYLKIPLWLHLLCGLGQRCPDILPIPFLISIFMSIDTTDWSRGPKKGVSASANFTAGNTCNTISFSITAIRLDAWMTHRLIAILF